MKQFFDSVRAGFGPLDQNQVDGFIRLVNATNGMLKNHRSYILATAWHETAHTMQPIVERGSKDYFKKYDGRKDLGNTIAGDGYRFKGRGDVQITGRRNYHLFSKKLGIDLVGNPELALDPEISAKIIVLGMTEGLFTGKAMKHFDNYKDMRRVVNGTDRADLIAGYARTFERAVDSIDAQSEKPVIAQEIPTKTDNPALPPSKPTGGVSAKQAGMGVIAFLIALVAAAFGLGG